MAGRYSQCDDSCTVDCGHCKGAGAPLVAGAIGRALTDARAAYRQQLDGLWREVVAALPDD